MLAVSKPPAPGGVPGTLTQGHPRPASGRAAWRARSGGDRGRSTGNLPRVLGTLAGPGAGERREADAVAEPIIADREAGVPHGDRPIVPSGPRPAGARTAPRRSHSMPSEEVASAMRNEPPTSLA